MYYLPYSFWVIILFKNDIVNGCLKKIALPMGVLPVTPLVWWPGYVNFLFCVLGILV